MKLRRLYATIRQRFGIGSILIFIVSAHIVIIFLNSLFIKYVLFQIEDDAMLINQSGKIRGGIQRIVKQKLNNVEINEDIKTIDSLFDDFFVEQKYKVYSPTMKTFLFKLGKLQNEWERLKETFKLDIISPFEREKILLISENIWKLSEEALETASSISTKKTNTLSAIFLLFLIEFLLILFIIYIINVKIRNKLEITSTTDPLTKASNRNVYDDSMKNLLTHVKDFDLSSAYIMLDIDFFKKINDTFGHDKGDEVLINLVSLLRKNIRKTDSLFRIGGEEFVVLARDIEMGGLEKLCEALRKHVEGFDFGLGQKVTISIGATMFLKDDTKDSIFKRADNALYESKNSGRNRITVV